MSRKILLLTIVFVLIGLSINTIPAQSIINPSIGHSLPNQQPTQEPDENISEPVIYLPDTQFEYGSDINITVGMEVSENETKSYISGYNFSLLLVEINETHSLFNGTTLENLVNINIPTYTPDSAKRITPGNYTLKLEVYSLFRGLISINASIEVFSNPAANVQFSVRQLVRNGFELNRSETFELLLENIGASNAFNVSVDIQSIEAPSGLSHNSTFPYLKSVMTSGEVLRLQFNIQPERFGIGSVTFRTLFSNADSTSSTGTLTIQIEVLPRILPALAIEPELFQGNTTSVEVIIRNQEEIPITISIDLSSSKIIFTEDPDERFTFSGTFSQEFSGTVFSTGESYITLTVYFYDSDGSSNAILAKITIPITINENVIDVGTDDTSNLLTILIITIIIILIIILVLILAFFLSSNIRYKILEQILPDRLNKQLKFPSNTIIVDGSNVAWDEPTPNNKASLENLLDCINELKKAGFAKITVIVDAALRYQVEDTKKFDKAAKQGYFKVLPAKVSGDLFILRLSQETEAMILTNDLFKEFRENFPFIDERRVPFSFLDGEFFLHPTADDF